MAKIQEAALTSPAYEPEVMMQPGFDATASASRYEKAFASTDDLQVIDMSYTTSAPASTKQYGRNDLVVVV